MHDSTEKIVVMAVVVALIMGTVGFYLTRQFRAISDDQIEDVVCRLVKPEFLIEGACK